MALVGLVGKKKEVTVKESQYKEDGDFRTPQIKTQKGSYLIKEQEEWDNLVHDVYQEVDRKFDKEKLDGQKISNKANKKWKQVYQVNVIKDDGTLAPYKELEFDTDTAYYEWWDNGGADKDLKEGREYTVVRVIVPR